MKTLAVSQDLGRCLPRQNFKTSEVCTN